MKIVRIPRTPASAFDKNRPASELLKAQVRHARAVDMTLSPERRTAAAEPAVGTEQEAAEYVGQVTKQLNPKAGAAWRLPRGPRAPKSGVWLGPARLQPTARKKARKPAKRRTRTATKPRSAQRLKATQRVKARATQRRTKKHARRR